MTVPAPVGPVSETLRAYWITTGLNVAVTFWLEFIVTLHEAVPEQAPLHPPKDDPAAANAPRTTVVPELYV